MDKESLLQLYEDGRLDSPSVLVNVRQDVEEYTGLVVPRRKGDVREWWPDNKSVFARKITEDLEDADDERNNTGDTE